MYSDHIIYGIHPVEELLKSRFSSVDHVYIESGKKSAQLFEILKTCRKERLSYRLVPETTLRHLAGVPNHQGVAAQCSVLPYAEMDTVLEMLDGKKYPLLVVPASIEDTGNLGAIIRSAVALCADAVLLEKKHTAPLNASVAKSSAGMVEHLPIARPKNLEGIITDFKNSGYCVVGTVMKKGEHPQTIDFRQPIVLILGGENRGIPPYLLRLCTRFASIPMGEKASSLNVAATAAILLYEIARQRASAKSATP